MTRRALLAFTILIAAYAALAVHLGPQHMYARATLIGAAVSWIVVLGLRKRAAESDAPVNDDDTVGSWVWAISAAVAWIVSAVVVDSLRTPGFLAWSQFAATVAVGAVAYRSSPAIRRMIGDYCRGESGRN